MMKSILGIATELGVDLQAVPAWRVKYRLVAIITDKKGNMLSTGVNSYSKTHPAQAKFASKSSNPKRVMLHAEIDAINKLKSKTLKPYAIYIARVNKNGEVGLAKPCDCCMAAITAHKIKKIIHT